MSWQREYGDKLYSVIPFTDIFSDCSGKLCGSAVLITELFEMIIDTQV